MRGLAVRILAGFVGAGSSPLRCPPQRPHRRYHTPPALTAPPLPHAAVIAHPTGRRGRTRSAASLHRSSPRAALSAFSTHPSVYCCSLRLLACVHASAVVTLSVLVGESPTLRRSSRCERCVHNAFLDQCLLYHQLAPFVFASLPVSIRTWQYTPPWRSAHALIPIKVWADCLRLSQAYCSHTF